jgi:hypothetical protein
MLHPKGKFNDYDQTLVGWIDRCRHVHNLRRCSRELRNQATRRHERQCERLLHWPLDSQQCSHSKTAHRRICYAARPCARRRLRLRRQSDDMLKKAPGTCSTRSLRSSRRRRAGAIQRRARHRDQRLRTDVRSGPGKRPLDTIALFGSGPILLKKGGCCDAEISVIQSVYLTGLKIMMGHRQVEQAALFYEFSLVKHETYTRRPPTRVDQQVRRPSRDQAGHRTTAAFFNRIGQKLIPVIWSRRAARDPIPLRPFASKQFIEPKGIAHAKNVARSVVI